MVLDQPHLLVRGEELGVLDLAGLVHVELLEELFDEHLAEVGVALEEMLPERFERDRPGPREVQVQEVVLRPLENVLVGTCRNLEHSKITFDLN